MAPSIFPARTAVSSQVMGDEKMHVCKHVRAELGRLGDNGGGLICCDAQFFKLSNVTRNRRCVDL